jgi:argininosuccinate lyase
VTGPLWKGRFGKSPAAELHDFSSSLGFDRRLWSQDIRATKAHVGGLVRAQILTTDERAEIFEALEEAAAQFSEGTFAYGESDEDIHSAIERFLTERLGDLGAKIHAGRSRNDLVATDLRLWLKDTIPVIVAGLHRLELAILDQAEANQTSLVPGYTHLQRAQPVLLPHLLLAHGFSLTRDFRRLAQAYQAADVSVLGAAAFAGTTLPLDPEATAAELGFSAVFDNAADAVSARDFCVEFLSASAILGVHLSRLGEEIVIWATQEFGFLRLDDGYSTGSSIMPQKRNPDVAELVRAKSARLTSDLVRLLGVLKGLPMAYNRDLQEDKEPIFDAADTLIGTLAALGGAVETLRFNPDRMEAAARQGASGATDIAEGLVLKGVPFRQAHEAVGRLVALAEQSGRELGELTETELAGIHPSLNPQMLDLLDPRVSVASRATHGGTSPESIQQQLAAMRSATERQSVWLGELAGGALQG